MKRTRALYAVILAGGQGTRFWPLSRSDRPKQFLALERGKTESLIESTLERVRPLVSEDKVLIVSNQVHENMLKQCAPRASVISEPLGKNTAASIGLAASFLYKKDPEALMVVLPADHVVQDAQALRQTLETAIDAASQSDCLVTIVITPSSANTGYGYIKRGKAQSGFGARKVYAVQRFFEKPSLERARKYCESGEYYWNSGMFVWRVESILNALAKFMPELHVGLTKIGAAIDSDTELQTIAEVFNGLEALSIDFGVLEHAQNCMVVEALPLGWNDVGSWDAWAAQFEGDASANVLVGNVLSIESQNCIVRTDCSEESRLIVILGVSDLVVVDCQDALLVCSRERTQDVKQVTQMLRKLGKQELV